ncbi:MAG: LysR family transcriptional regulator [Lachnospiraceae bacterium]
MNLKNIEYIVKIAEERNVSKAAGKLFITPSALNQHLLHLEEDIGTPLFHRSRSGWTPTEAGEVYLSTAREMLHMRREAYKRLQDITASQKGTLTIGFPPERGSTMFTKVYPLFHQDYPDVTINVIEANVRKQQQLISQNVLDIGFMTLRETQKTDDEYIHICDEELVIVVPAEHPVCDDYENKKANGIAAGAKYPELDITTLRYEPFALMYRESTIFAAIDQVFRESGFVPNVLFQTVRAVTIIDMVASRLCCSIVPDSDSIPHPKEVAFFHMPDHPSWSIYASYKKNTYLSKQAKHFIELAMNYWNHQLT